MEPYYRHHLESAVGIGLIGLGLVFVGGVVALFALL